VGGFVVGDLFRVVVEGVRECCFDAVSLGVIGETFAVELVLEVLEGESVVEDANSKMSGQGRQLSTENGISATPLDGR
jgi:hypothetical protein